MEVRSKIKQFSLKAPLFFVVICCFFIPLSSALMNVSALLMLFFWIITGGFRTRIPLSFKTFIGVVAFLLFLLFSIAVYYSPVPLEESLAVLKKYRELFYITMLIVLLHSRASVARKAEISFALGCTVLLGISYAMYFSLIPTDKYGYSTLYHITHSFFMAFFGFWCLQKIMFRKRFLVVWAGFFIATVFNLFYIAPGRTGMLVFCALLILALFQHLSWKKSLSAVIAVAVLMTAVFFTSDNFSTRVKEAVSEVRNYHATSSRTSLGMRFDWWYNSIELIRTKPLLGYGTGSFAAVQGELIENEHTRTKASDNPHNEYLFIGVQTGLVGLALFLLLLASLFVYSAKLPPEKRSLLQGVVTAIAVGCLMNSFLFDTHEGHFFAVISAVLCSFDSSSSA
ncbi:O-antigen ligase family protein [Desulforhopalus singaporensis]|uniref:O-antigen ligase n=1 Tax=Desulforhopalus singaporensis TaxID=91360 RepID=A0A1H0PY81_9BACT|nr:O-antigen ligase family protein [Desulforhopalus singaporensis]SDP10082.1 O-antigen ligase [Desulforhopalus singaporensis]